MCFIFEPGLKLLHTVIPKYFSSTTCNIFLFYAGKYRVDALSYFQCYTFVGVDI